MANADNPLNPKGKQRVSGLRLAIGLLLMLFAIALIAGPEDGIDTIVGNLHLTKEYAIYLGAPILSAGLTLLLTSFEEFGATISGPIKLFGMELGGIFQGFALLFAGTLIGLFAVLYFVLDPLGDERRELEEQTKALADLRKDIDRALGRMGDAAGLQKALQSRIKEDNILENIFTTYMAGQELKMNVQFQCPDEREPRLLGWTDDADGTIKLALHTITDGEPISASGKGVPITILGNGDQLNVSLFPESHFRRHTEALDMYFSFEKHSGITATIRAWDLTALVDKCDEFRQEGVATAEYKADNAEADSQEETVPPPLSD